MLDSYQDVCQSLIHEAAQNSNAEYGGILNFFKLKVYYWAKHKKVVSGKIRLF